MKKITIVIILTCVVFEVSAVNHKDSLVSLIENYATDSLINGVVLIAKGDEIIFKGSYGYKNIDKKEVNTSSTVYAIGSVTKQFTSTAILILHERKLLSIEDKISEYIDVPYSMKDVSIKNLMNHTSGIPDYWPQNIENTKKAIFEFLFSKDTLYFEPNTKHIYCNSNYFLLGQIIESVSGKSYNDFLEENIFTPLGMQNTFVNGGKNYDRAIGYTEKWEKNDFLISTGDGGILSTVEDLYLWDKALFENKILKPESKEIMFKPSVLHKGKTINYGFGWEIYKKNKNIVFLTGNLASFGAYNQINKKTGYFIILLSNQIRPELIDFIKDVNRKLRKMN